MWLVFDVFGRSIPQLLFGILNVSLEVLMLRTALAGLCDVNLHVQIRGKRAWCDFTLPILWQVPPFVHLGPQVSQQAQHFGP